MKNILITGGAGFVGSNLIRYLKNKYSAVFSRNCAEKTYLARFFICRRLAGQNYEYLVKQLRRLKSGARRDIDGTMASAAQALSEQDIENVSHFLSGLK